MSEYYYQDNLESDRLRTRFLQKDDVQKWIPFCEDEEAVTFLKLFMKPNHLESSQNWIDRQLSRYQEKRYGLQAVLDKNTGELLGQTGLLKQEIDGKWEIEVGYHMFKKNWGKGYAPEAARLFIDFVFSNNLAPSVISIIDINNVNSQRVAEKNGLKRETQTRWQGMDVFIYRIHKADWK